MKESVKAMRRKNQTNKTSFFSDLKVYFRNLKVTYNLDRKFFLMQMINAFGDKFRPFLNSFLAAIIINGIYEGRSEKVLILYALTVVILNFIINLAVLFTANRRYIRKSMWPKIMSIFFNTCSQNMDYAYFEDIKVKDMRRQIDRNVSLGKGIGDYWQWWNIVAGTTGVVTSVSILLALVMQTSKEPVSGILYFVNTPWAVLIFIAILALAFLNSSKIERFYANQYRNSNTAYSKIYAKNNKMSKYPVDTKLAMDMNICGLESIVCSCAEKSINDDIQYIKKMNIELATWQTVSTTISAFIKLFVCLFVGLKALSGAFGIGSLVLYVTTILNFSFAIENFGRALGNIRGSRKLYDEGFAYIDIKNNMKHRDTHPDFSRGFHMVEFCNVSFKYPGSATYSLRNINIKFGGEEKLAIVGMNGSGKTTFIKLLCRLYDPTEGKILLDGIDIREYDYHEYLKLFSVVFQDFKLFAFPLAQNVAADSAYDRELVKSSLVRAGMSERLKTMPNGLDTCIYKNFDTEGIEISGGEAQKIALARALYKDAPIVVLDEPTAALDPIAESEIYNRFNDMIVGKTAVYISHRLSSCQFCDKIAVFDDGELIQLGKHAELLESPNSQYSEMWYAQAQYYN